MALTREMLIDYLDSELGLDRKTLDGTTLLFSTGLIDSFALVSLMSYIEKECGRKINPSDVTLDNLDSIDRILALSSRLA